MTVAMRVLEASSFLGAAVLIWTVFSVAFRPRRVQGVVVGSVGMIAGAAAALGSTLVDVFRGVDIDHIPHEIAAQWFVAAFGWAGLLAWIAAAFVPPVRDRLRKRTRTFERAERRLRKAG
jgi:hypothetical protein